MNLRGKEASSPIENSTWSRWLAPKRGRKSGRSRTAPAAAAARKASGSAARNGTPRRVIATTQTYPPAIAKAPWARLTKFMRPIVTDRPTLTRKRTLPYAMPSKRTPATISLSLGRGPGRGSLSWILHVRKFVELDVPILVAALFHAPHVDGLHDFARRRVDRDRPVRAREIHVLQQLHRIVCVGLVAELLHTLIARRHTGLAPHFP